MKEERNVAFLKGTMALSVAVIITKVLGVAFKVPLSYVLGDEGMGYFNTAYAIYGLFYILCTAGVPKSLTLVLAENRNGKPSNDTDMEILKTGCEKAEEKARQTLSAVRKSMKIDYFDDNSLL